MTKIYHADLWGSREDKYRYLQEHDVTTVEWTEIFPQSPFYLFCPQNTDLLAEYNSACKTQKLCQFIQQGLKPIAIILYWMLIYQNCENA